MSSDDSRTELNHAWWNERAGLHRQTPLYQKHIDCLSGGGLSLLPVEVGELGDIRGLNVLHLQCHIGTDTLSLSRLGATVTGVDFSDPAIALDRSLSNELAIDVRFVDPNVYDLSENLEGQLDIVFTSYGARYWLPDLPAWARIVAHFLKPDGVFYVVDGHPSGHMLGGKRSDSLVVQYPYFNSDEPMPSKPDRKGDYADETAIATKAECG